MVKVKKLSNGLTVVMEKMNYLRSVSFGVWIKVGSVNEKKENNGIAHMIEHMLFKGTKNRSAKKLADDMTAIGGNTNAFTSKECTSFYVTTLDEHLEAAVDIISDMIMNSLFEEKSIEREKKVVMEEIDMYDDSPEDIVHEQIQRNIWREHPLGYLISGKKEIVSRFTREQIVAFKEKYYAAENMVLSIAGNFEEDMVLDLFEKKFYGIGHLKTMPKIQPPQYNRCLFHKKKDIEQIHMILAYDSISYNTDEKYPLSVLNAILGGNGNSRLFQRIREEQGLSYSVYSYGASFRNAGLFQIYAAMNTEQTYQVYEEILKVLEEMKLNGVTEEELNQTKEQIKTELIISRENTKNRMNSNGKSVLNRGEITSVDESINKINAVSREEIHFFMNKYFDPDTASLSLVGNIDHPKVSITEKSWQKLSSGKQ